MAQISGALSRFWQFVACSYAPALHLAFAAAWYIALAWLLIVTGSDVRHFPFDLGLLVGIGTYFLNLFVLRVADEIKDFDYDKLHNPERPLVRGAVTIKELNVYVIITLGLVALANTPLHPYLVLIALLDIGYGYSLIAVERLFPKVADHQFLNLIVTYPVNVMLSVYLYVLMILQYHLTVSIWGIALIAAFAAAFLHFEFSRKIARPAFATSGERLYSNHLSATLMGAYALALALFAIAVTFIAFKPWQEHGIMALAGYMPIVPLLVAIFNYYRFFTKSNERYNLKPLAMLFLTTFYFSIVFHLLVNMFYI